MKKIFFIISCFIIFISSSPNDFKSEQLKFSRVREAYQNKESFLKKLLAEKNISSFNIEILIRGFKKEKILEVWAKEKSKEKFTHLKDYDFCTLSGTPGPKRLRGDGQVPEGFYYINRFNPFSSFWLSLGINFPNEADKILSKGKNAGGDIFIHGNCVSIGCIPITNDKIEELYLLAVEATAHGQTKIPVHIFPSLMDDKNLDETMSENKNMSPHFSFWKNLKTGYDYFETNHNLSSVRVDKNGTYIFR